MVKSVKWGDMEKGGCIICAWRRDCQKRFIVEDSLSFFCPDFCLDLSIVKEKTNDEGMRKDNDKEKKEKGTV